MIINSVQMNLETLLVNVYIEKGSSVKEKNKVTIRKVSLCSWL